MLSLIKTLLAVSAIAALPAVFAQNATEAQLQQKRISDCSLTIETPDFDFAYNFDVSDTTPYSLTYTWDYNTCRDIPVQGVTLVNQATGTVTRCTSTQFTTAEMFVSTCQTTRGAIAREAGPEGTDFSNLLRFGIRPTFFTREDLFTVYGQDATTTMVSSTSATATATSPATTTTPPATVSEASRRRRRAVSNDELVLDSSMICDAGHSSCPMQDSRKRWFSRCIDTSSELYACGGCPGSAETQDCSELKGVADVRCVAGACQIKQCDRSHKLSSDGKTCVRKESIKKRSLW